MKHKGKNIFNQVDRQRIRRSGFDLSHEYKTTHDFFDLIPISVIECVPGDVHQIGVSSVLRFQPLLAPILHSIKMRFTSFFVSYRDLDPDNWVEFITRNPDGDTVGTLPLFNPADYGTPANVYAAGTLWDYLGYPLLQPPSQACPIDYPRRAYYRIFNEFFRDENLETEIDYLDPASNSFNILRSAWQRDLYTSSLPFRQKGTAPSLPVFGTASAVFDIQPVTLDGGGGVPFVMGFESDSAPPLAGAIEWGGTYIANPTTQMAQMNETLGENTISGSGFSASDITDLRLATQLQVWMENNARGGTRYTEFLRKQFDTSPTDTTLNRPHFIGSVVSDVIISEVMQTSASDTQPTAQGNLAGAGLGLANGMIGSYRCKEFGLIMTLATVVPNSAYQQGIDRSWLRRNTFDFPFPVFANLSEQEVLNAEVYTRDVAADPTGAINRTPFGYTGRYNELRFVPNRVTGQMRSTFDYWHLGRQFSSAPALNADFIRPTAAEVTELKRVFAVPSEPGLVVSYGIKLNSYRPIPYMAIPSSLGGL